MFVPYKFTIGQPHYPSRWFLNLSPRQHYLEGSLVKTQIAGSNPGFLIRQAWDGTYECACLTRSQELLMLRVLGPHTENHRHTTVSNI